MSVIDKHSLFGLIVDCKLKERMILLTISPVLVTFGPSFQNGATYLLRT
jgi:hypothetical protein